MGVSILGSYISGYTNSSNTHNITQNLQAGSNRIVVIGVVARRASGSFSINSVTYDGTAATHIVTAQEANAYATVALYYIPEASLPGTTGNKTVSVITSAVVDDLGLFCITIQDAEQSSIPEDSGSKTGSGSNDSVLLTVSGGAFQIDAVSHRSNSYTLTWGTGQTERWDEDIGTVQAGSSTQTGAGAGSETLSFTSSGSGYYAYAGVSFAAVPNPTATILGAVVGLHDPSIGTYDTRFKMRARARDTALGTRVRNE